MRSSLILSRRDLDFLLHEWLEVESLTKRARFAEHSRETFDAASTSPSRSRPSTSRRTTARPTRTSRGWSTARSSSIPEVAAALKVFAEAGLMAGEFDEEFGGMQLPHVVGQAVFAWFKAANVGTSSYPFLTMGNARLLLAHGSPEQIDTYVAPEVEGRWFGTMALSEPQAGSSLADITTRAEPQDDGTYRLTGNKMWISAGDHELTENIVHLVLAKIPGGPPGVKGISLFIVPKFLVNDDGSLGERNDVVLAGLNHKMGYRGTTNTLLNFGEGVHTPGGRAGAVGYLVGEPHRGLTYMFHMMNEARIGVGMGATVLGYTGYLHAARVRAHPHPGPPGRRRRTRPRRRCRSSSTPTCAGCCWPRSPTRKAASRSGCTAPGWSTRSRPPRRQAERDRAHLLLDMLTPIAKAGRRSGAWRPTTSPSRCTAATATPATTRSSSSTATTGSTRSTRAPTASRRSTCSAARR